MLIISRFGFCLSVKLRGFQLPIDIRNGWRWNFYNFLFLLILGFARRTRTQIGIG